MEEDIIDQLYFGRIVPWERQVEKPPEIEQCSESRWMKLAKMFWNGFWITILK